MAATDDPPHTDDGDGENVNDGPAARDSGSERLTSLHPGDEVADVQVIELLAAGASTETWRGRRSDGSEVVVKSLRPGMSARARDYFLAAASDLSEALKERPITGLLLSSGVDPAAGAYVADVAALGTMADVPILKWTPQQQLEFMRQLCVGLQGLHGAKMVHGCLEPETILLDGMLRPVLSNAGVVDVAALCQETPDMAELHRAYSAPEVCAGQKADARSDVFSAGRLLHYMLLGDEPNEQDETIPRLDSLRACSPGLVRIVRKCTTRKPERRYPEAGALLADLDRYAREEPCGLRHPDVDDQSRFTESGGQLADGSPGGRPRPALRPRPKPRPATAEASNASTGRHGEALPRGRKRSNSLAWSRKKAALFAGVGLVALTVAIAASYGKGTAPLVWQVVALLAGATMGLAVPGVGRSPALSRLLAVCAGLALFGHLDPTGIAAQHKGARAGLGDPDPAKRVATLKAMVEAGTRQFPKLDLSGADLAGAKLNELTLDGSSLRGANCQGADFTNSSLINVEVSEANLGGAKLGGVFPEFIRGWTNAKCDEKTQMPDAWKCANNHPVPTK